MKKKVIFVITKGSWGGAQRYVFDLATHLPRDRFALCVAYGQAGLLAKRLESENIPVYPILSLQRDISLRADIHSFFELYRLFKKEKPDIVHLNSSKAGGLGALAARMAGVGRVIFTVHGLPWDENRNVFSKFLIYLTSRITFLLCNEIIVVSKDNQRRVPHSTLIYNGIAPLQLGSGEIIRNAFPAGVRITGTIGELTHNKNHIALIKQAKQDPTLYVAIVGEGELRPMLEEKIRMYGLRERVKLFGFLPPQNVLTGFDTFALPSLKEGLPYALLEAKQAGLPIRANRVGGVGEILDAKDLQEFSLEKMVEKTATIYERP